MMLVSLCYTLGAAVVVAAMPALAVPAPSRGEVAPRTAISTICGKNDLVYAADYILYNNLWGESDATSGSQCTSLDYDSSNRISWQTSWSWEGGQYDVKSYANAVLNVGAQKLSSFSSIPTTWSWSYTGTDIVADVSYDAFLSSTDSTSAAHKYEVMVWLAALGGAAPIGNGDGAIASPTIGGLTWELYEGTNGWTVYSFVAKSKQTDFSGDMMEFFNYLIDNRGVPSSYYLQTIGAGTEPFTGSDALFTTSPYTISLNT